MPSVKYETIKLSAQQCAKLFQQAVVKWPVYLELFDHYLLTEQKDLVEAHELALAAAQIFIKKQKKSSPENELLGKHSKKNGKIHISLPNGEQVIIGVVSGITQPYKALREMGVRLFEVHYEPRKTIAKAVAKIKKL